MSTPFLFTADDFGDFLSIGATKQLITLARGTNPEWMRDGMSGYDIDEFVTGSLSEELKDQISPDPESGGYVAYFRKKTGGRVTAEDLEAVQSWVAKASIEIHESLVRRLQKKIEENSAKNQQIIADILARDFQGEKTRYSRV
jgi:hypothetical protein